MAQNRLASRKSRVGTTSSRPARPRSGAEPASRRPITDSAEPHSSSRVREPRRRGRRGPNAAWIIDGSSGDAFTK
jgi:hypothetical protein